MGRAHSALGTASDRTRTNQPEHPPIRALELVAGLGWSCDSGAVALRQLESALAALDAVGMPPSPEHLRTYADAALSVARADVADVPRNSGPDAVAFVILGTVLYEPLLLALRRIAQQHAYGRLASDTDRTIE